MDTLKLHKAKNGQKIQKYLSEGGVSSISIDGRGDPPIHAFIRRTDQAQSLDCLFAFLIYGDYNIDILNADKDTPLHLACKLQRINFVKALIAFDAELNIFNRDNCTALDIAQANECEEIATLLEEVGGLTAKSISDGTQQELEECDLWSPDMDKAMAKGVIDMTKTLVYSPRLKAKGQTGNGTNSDDGVSPSVLNSRLEGMYENDHMVGYQVDDYDGQDNALFSPCEEMYSIPEGSDEESEEAEIAEASRVLDHMNSSICISKPLMTTSQYDRTLTAKGGDRSPSPGRSSPSRHHSPSRPSTLLQSNVSPTSSPRSSRKFPGGSTYHTPLTASLLPKSHRSRSPPPEVYQSPYGQSPVIHKSPVHTPPRSRSPNNLSPRSPFPDRVSTTPLNGIELNKHKHGAIQKNGDGVDDDDDDDEAIGGEEDYYKRCMQRLAQTVLTCLDDVDPETRKKLENGLRNNLREKDFLELHNKKASQSPKHLRNEKVAVKKDLLSPQFNMDDQADLPQDYQYRRYSEGDKLRRKRLPSVGESIRKYRLRSPQAAMQSSLSTSKSLYNPQMSVMQSGLGTSVKPTTKPVKEGQRGHRILCLDGGGIKGVIELEILRAIERLSDTSIPELFDWVVATSIGGIFALSMVYGKLSISDLLKFCFRMKADVGKKQSWWKYSCNTEALESLLKNMLGEDTKMEEKKTKVMVTAVRKGDTSLPLVFFNNCFHDENYGDILWKVGRRTSAIPALFRSADGYIDGGLVANNPCNYGLTKIKMFLKDTKDKQKERGDKKTICTDIACVLSIGCGKFPSQKIGISDIDDSVLFTRPLEAPQRIKNALTTLLCCIGRSEEDANICRIFCEEMQVPFYRFSPNVDVLLEASDTDNMKICEAIISAKKMLHTEEAHLETLVRDLGKQPIPQTKVV